MDAELADDPRQRVADIVAVAVLTQYNLKEAEANLSRLGSMVCAYCASESPETLQKYSEMDWQEAVREIKIAFAKHYLASQGAGPGELPPQSVDENIGKCLVAAFLKFITFRSINPTWYGPHLEDMQLAPEPITSV